MNWQLVTPVVEPSVRQLCTRPYPGHPKGCPNYNKKAGCPPQVELVTEILDFKEPLYVVWNRFDLAQHRRRMLNLHPDWSRRQLDCCLYWQKGARKQLDLQLAQAYLEIQGGSENRLVLTCPEATGVNVTATMKSIGIELEWPPVHYAYQVALVGEQKDNPVCSSCVSLHNPCTGADPKMPAHIAVDKCSICHELKETAPDVQGHPHPSAHDLV